MINTAQLISELDVLNDPDVSDKWDELILAMRALEKDANLEEQDEHLDSW